MPSAAPLSIIHTGITSKINNASPAWLRAGDVFAVIIMLVGVAAFLPSSMDMALTAILLTLEFTRVSHDFCAPIFLAVAESVRSCW